MVYAERAQLFPRYAREVVADNEVQIERFCHRFNAAQQIDGGPDNSEIKSVRRTDIAVDDSAEVERDDHVQRRLTGESMIQRVHRP